MNPRWYDAERIAQLPFKAETARLAGQKRWHLQLLEDFEGVITRTKGEMLCRPRITKAAGTELLTGGRFVSCASCARLFQRLLDHREESGPIRLYVEDIPRPDGLLSHQGHVWRTTGRLMPPAMGLYPKNMIEVACVDGPRCPKGELYGIPFGTLVRPLKETYVEQASASPAAH